MRKIAGSKSRSISQRHGSADPDPDPPQNVMDPQHWLAELIPCNRFLGSLKVRKFGLRLRLLIGFEFCANGKL
jgi:hypothetical protein